MEVFLRKTIYYYRIEYLESNAVTADDDDLSNIVSLVAWFSQLGIIFKSTIYSMMMENIQGGSDLWCSFVKYYEI